MFSPLFNLEQGDKSACDLEETVGQGGFTVVDMGNNREVPDPFHRKRMMSETSLHVN
jgi:hypothetical protein